MAASDFFRGSARPEFSGESNFTSVGGNSSSSAIQHIFNINHPTNIFVYNYGNPPNSPIAQAWPPANVNVNGQDQPTGRSPSPSGQAPPVIERSDGDLVHGSPADASKKVRLLVRSPPSLPLIHVWLFLAHSVGANSYFFVFSVETIAGIEEAVGEV